MKKGILSAMMVSLLIGIAPVFAQTDLQIAVQTPDDLQFDQETIVTIEVTSEGDPFEVEDFSVRYLPEDGVFDEVVYDCHDPEVMDNCRANNRGVAGIFEAVFDLKKLPLTLVVEADGVTEEVELQEAARVTIPEETPPVSEVKASAPETTLAPESTISPAAVQVGPSPSWWIILAPLFLMCAVVTYFVAKTTK